MIRLLPFNSPDEQTAFSRSTVLRFIIAGILWIVVSDGVFILLQHTTLEEFTLLRIELLKGVGSVVAMGVIFYLILQRHQRKNQNNFESNNFFAESNIPMLILDAEKSLLLESNEAAQSAYGYSRQELTSVSFGDIFGSDTDKHSIFSTSATSGHVTSVNGSIICRSGSFISAELSCLPIISKKRPAILIIISHRTPDEENHVFDNQFIQGINDRIAELSLTIKELEVRNREINATNDELINLNNMLQNANKRLLVESEETRRRQTGYLKQLMNYASEAIWSFDLTGKDENFVNACALNLFGLPADKIIDCPNFWLTFVSHNEKEKVADTLKQLECSDSAEVAYTLTNEKNTKVIQRINIIRNQNGPIRLEFIAREEGLR